MTACPLLLPRGNVAGTEKKVERTTAKKKATRSAKTEEVKTTTPKLSTRGTTK